MIGASFLRRFLRDEDGASIVEFAVVSVVFFTLVCSMIEYGLILFTKVEIESVTSGVARESGINSAGSTGCSDRICVIQTLIEQNTLDLINKEDVVVTSRVITSKSTLPPPEPDKCLNDPEDPYPASCPTGGGGYINNDGVPGYQAPDVDAGQSNQLVQISVFYTWDVIFPLMRPFFANGEYKITATTVVRNEPFASP